MNLLTLLPTWASAKRVPGPANDCPYLLEWTSAAMHDGLADYERLVFRRSKTRDDLEEEFVDLVVGVLPQTRDLLRELYLIGDDAFSFNGKQFLRQWEDVLNSLVGDHEAAKTYSLLVY